jgi:hypothetical protein
MLQTLTAEPTGLIADLRVARSTPNDLIVTLFLIVSL